ncbi:3'-5' exoribonuclease HELZ2 [Trichomycterus rosablanca]|uniref:3'-5' exoribonuclease HELZ2 n=1 Tax=Trichomycterus rosablanca TaxID=2290929 RepID=UPI002F35CA8E
MRPVLLQKLKVRVGVVDRSQLCPQPERNQGNKKTQQDTNSSIRKLESESTQQSEQLPVIWHEDTVEIVPYQKRSEAYQELLRKYSYVKRKEFSTVMIDADLINQQNYKEKMHSFLYQEEMEQDQLVSRGSVAPLLIYGPFGTGKTLTLAKITLALVQQPQNRILICTHTNSSADLYVRNHFHNSATTAKGPVRLLRIKAKESSPRATDPVTLQYCHLSKDHWCFEFPDRETLDSARIIITTTGMARYFHDLQLPSNYFSHIFIDEASQMLECEALMAIGLAGEKTQVILAGDHMQMGPRLFSVGVDKSSDHTLLNRLFHHYQAENTTTAKNSRIIFNENYRSTQEIVDFVSKHFYVGKTDGIKAKGNVPAHPHQNALQFCHVRGECYLDKGSLSWFNPAEIQTVVDVVLKVLEKWPDEWQQNDSASVCVLSQGSQVIEIRKQLKQLREYNLHKVTVENAENVQGKQFRIIIITTVHTKDSLNKTERPCLEFFNDVRLLNTAMTRAQSQVIVVGDATALCCPYFGKCWRLWNSYINHCIGTGSVHPKEFTLNNLNQELLEISNIMRTEEDDSSDSDSTTSELPDNSEDPILKELLDEDEDLQIKLTEDGTFPFLHTDNLKNNVVRHVKESKPSRPQPDGTCQNSRICELVLKKFDSGFAMPLDEPSLQIRIEGKKNLKQSFSGDIVNVEILTTETFPPKGKVIEVIKRVDLPSEFVCTVDRNDDQVMAPIDICITKIFTPFWKDKPNYIAIRNPETWRVERFIRINEEARRNHLFVVKLLKWGEHFNFPLGIVVNALPIVTSLQDGLKILEIEYKLHRKVPQCVQKEVENLKYTPLWSNTREDFRELMTFTIDSSTSEDLDDAISVRDLGEHYEIGVHIADVASFVPKDSELDRYARQQGTSFYVSKSKPAHMFPEDLSTNIFSLLDDGCDRHCISLMTEVDKKTHRIQNRTFFKSVIRSKKRLSYEAAEKMLKASGNTRSFDTLEGCLAIACNFAEVHRKDRKQDDWCYRRPDEDEVVGSRRSHRLVEELMIMFNHFVADTLLLDGNARSLAPLRCQDRPDSDQLHDFQDKNVAWLPMSIHLSSHVGDFTPKEHEQLNLSGLNQTQNVEQEVLNNGIFPILTSVLKNLEIAAQDKDIHRIVDLVTTDDLHPQLLPLVIDLRRLINKAQVLRANSSHLSRIGHYDLQLDSYTWASSPIRRYIDVIVQRLLLSVLNNTEIKYTSHDIDMCCVEFSQKNRVQTICEKKSHALGVASQLSVQNALKVAYIVEVTPTSSSFRISIPLNKDFSQDMNNIMYRDLQLADQPWYDKFNDCMVLKWVRRIYSFADTCLHNDLKEQQANSVITYVPNKHWKDLVVAIKEENWDLIYKVIKEMNATVTRQPIRKKTQIPVKASGTGASSLKEEHFMELSLELRKGDIIEIQLGTDTVRGLLVPAVQLLIVNPNFEICLGHTKDPIISFSKYALHASRPSYNTYVDYQKIWKPLCEMESACNAVAENESIVFEETMLKWKPLKEKENLQGCFHLPLEKKDQWAIEGNLRNSFLCIRLRIQQKDLSPVLEDSLTDSKDLNLMSSSGLIWIAHGIVTSVSGEEESKEQTYMKIDFCINHMPMTKLPESIFLKSARYTVEVIPKLLPDVRKESAIDNLTTANNLVKAIATGKRTSDTGIQIHTKGPSRLEIEGHKSLGLPQLNVSQCKAIREALHKEFTLIQGPPGTGKTVVGVHIVYWFFQENQKLPPPHGAEEGQKKRCILYCGPSNKSVDVVAGQLLKLEQKLKPLRIYSDQMEILEFPYPGSNLRLSRHSQRVEKPNKALRSISLHYKIRMPSNPYAAQIKAFDLKIEKKQDLTPEEVKSYKDSLRKARKHELLQHDVILCTCTAASHPLLANLLSIQQIIIDECAMATEPEAFIPLVTHKPKQIVLLGDHKQLQPVVHCELLKRLGMRKSLFERYMKKALMLDTQYRMQEDICEFPSKQFYEDKLKTGTKYKPSVFLTKSNNSTSIIFGHVEGKEISLVVSTERGNENSKANLEEANEAVRIAISLIEAGIKTKDMAILTPYNAQVAKINEILVEKNVENVTVSSIMKSQGSEWRYVILTTVRSCEKINIEEYSTKGWRMKNLGFVEDPHQVNVGITRAQEGLCIIGNKDLLRCSFLWKKLLNHYEAKGCVVDPAENIQIARY